MRNAVPRSLSESLFMTLLCITAKPCTATAIIQEVERLSKGRYHLTPATLDKSLRPLIEDEWIEHLATEQSYRMTDIGRIYLNGEINRLMMITRMSEQRAQICGK